MEGSKREVATKTMSEDTQGSDESRVKSVLQIISANAIFGGIFAVPAFLLIAELMPSATGYYAIGATALILHTSLIAMDTTRETPDFDINEMGRWERVVFLFVMAFSTVIAIGVRLGTGAILAAALIGSASTSPVGILVAAAFPVLERKLVDVEPRASPSVLVTLAALWLVLKLLSAKSILSGLTPESAVENTRRFGPV